MKTDFDIGIIGGGPAGSTAAIYLADAGFNVCLFERKIFPRETVCGEFLSEEVVNSISGMGILEEFFSLNPNQIKVFKLINDNGDEISSGLGFTAFGLKRSSFDNLLLQTAVKRGAKIFQPAEVKEVINKNNYFEIRFSDQDSRQNYLRTKKVICAYGKYSFLDRKLGRNFISEKSGLNGIKFHLRKSWLNNFNENEIHIYTSEGIYCGINLVNEDTVTVCFLENRDNTDPPVRKRILKLFNSVSPMKTILKESVENEINNTSLYGAGNIFFGKRNIVENGIFMIGDAAGVIAPLAGEGIALAMNSAKVISDVFRKTGISNNTDRLVILYKRAWENNFNRRLNTSAFIQNILLNNWKRRIGVSTLKLFPQMLPYLIKSTRS